MGNAPDSAKPRSTKTPGDKPNKNAKPRTEKANKSQGASKKGSAPAPAAAVAQETKAPLTSGAAAPVQASATPVLPGGEPHRVVNEMPPREGAPGRQNVVKSFFVPPSTHMAGGHDLPLLTPDQLEQPPPNQVPSTSYHPSTYFVPSPMGGHAPVYGWMPPPPGNMPMPPYGYPYGMMPQGMPAPHAGWRPTGPASHPAPGHSNSTPDHEETDASPPKSS